MVEISHSVFPKLFPACSVQLSRDNGQWRQPKRRPQKAMSQRQFPDPERSGPGLEVSMRYLRYFGLLAVLMVPLAYSQAQVRVGIGVGPVGVAVGAAPVCAYGYYGYYPYACAPYGYYGPDWFAGGLFVGAGPWFHGPVWLGRWGRVNGWYGRPWYGHPGWSRAY